MRPAVSSQVFDSHGRLITTLHSDQNRLPIDINKVPQNLQNAFIAAEDNRFYEHIGIDPIGIFRAIFANLTNRGIAQGGSTITQQLAKNAFLSQEQTLKRKIQEAMLALEIEHKYSKKEILEMYMNQIYFGQGAYGIQTAAKTYFNKDVNELTLTQCAMLAGLPKSPNYYSPFNKNYNRMCRVFDALFVGRYRRRGTRFLTKSELARKFLLEKRLSPEQVTTVGVGIDAELLRDRPDAGQTELEQKMRAQKTGLKLLYIGRIEPRRDPFFLLDVLAEVRKSDPDACLYIIGDGDAEYVDSVKAAIGEKGLESCVFWQKKAPQYQMKGVYQQADLFLLPTEYEIFGMVLLEAMFFRRVVLTTPNGGADMLLRSGENGLVLEKSDPARWAKTLLDIAADPEKKARMEQAAYETVIHENTWDALADRFLKVYEKR